MKPSEKTTKFHDDAPLDVRIQRCVDGELSDDAERRLLAWLEFQPDGWRRLALTFVEQRLLRSVAGGFLAGQAPGVRREIPPSRTHPAATRVLRWLALAVVLGMTFATGRWSSSAGRPSPSSGSVALDRSGADRPPRETRDVAHGRDLPSRNDELRRVESPATQQLVPATFVSLKVPGVEQQLSVPVYELPEGVSGWRPFPESRPRPEQLEQLRRAGYQVRANRRIVEVAAGETHSVWLPIETIRVQPARF